MSSEKLKDKFRGCMVGLAVGDALGASSEFMRKHEVQAAYGVLMDYHTAQGFSAGEFTDDTSMALAIAESIIEADSVEPEAIADRFIFWMETDGRGIGMLTSRALRLIREGAPPLKAGQIVWEETGRYSAGNGAVMRCAPIGLYDWQNAEYLAKDSFAVSRITHFDMRCCLSCVAVNTAIAAILRGEDDPLESAVQAVGYRNDELRIALESARKGKLEEMRLDGQDMGYTILTTQAAFTIFCHFDDFEKGIVAVVNEGGDADTNAAVAGALLGTRVGLTGIPERWVTGLIGLDRVLSAADGLYELAATAPG